MKTELPKRATRVRTDFGPVLPHHVYDRRCEYIPLSALAPIPDGVCVGCRWGSSYDRAYFVQGKCFLAWDDRSMPEPDGIQVRKGLYI